MMIKVRMNVASSEMIENTNILPLFSSIQVEISDPLQDLLNEAEMEAWEELEEAPIAKTSRVLVTDKQFPDQSLYTLEQQLENLNQSLGRLKFYLSDLNDLLPMR
jgi:hypothetical protein